MTPQSFFRHVTIAVALLVAASSASAQTDPLVGKWKMNMAKSKYSPDKLPKSENVVYTAAGTGVKYVVDRVEADGKPAHLEGTIAIDGKDYPATGTPDWDMYSTTHDNANVTRTARKKGGKVVQIVLRTVSKDGKTLTLTTTGVDAKGTKIDNTGVYDRQP